MPHDFAKNVDAIEGMFKLLDEQFYKNLKKESFESYAAIGFTIEKARNLTAIDQQLKFYQTISNKLQEKMNDIFNKKDPTSTMAIQWPTQKQPTNESVSKLKQDIQERMIDKVQQYYDELAATQPFSITIKDLKKINKDLMDVFLSPKLSSYTGKNQKDITLLLNTMGEKSTAELGKMPADEQLQFYKSLKKNIENGVENISNTQDFNQTQRNNISRIIRKLDQHIKHIEEKEFLKTVEELSDKVSTYSTVVPTTLTDFAIRLRAHNMQEIPIRTTENLQKFKEIVDSLARTTINLKKSNPLTKFINYIYDKLWGKPTLHQSIAKTQEGEPYKTALQFSSKSSTNNVQPTNQEKPRNNLKP